jgi:hypothetical protein
MSPKQQQQFKAPSHIAETGLTPAAVVSPAPLVGTWNNINKATNDLVKIIIAGSGSTISVDVFGACSPTPCNWGTVSGIAYADNVSASPAVAFSAQYTFTFAKASVVGHLQGNQLLVETFTEFTDGSGRSNLYTTDQMVK